MSAYSDAMNRNLDDDIKRKTLGRIVSDKYLGVV